MNRRRARISVERERDSLVVRWDTGRSAGRWRFHHLPGTTPPWLAAADDLDSLDRRSADAVVSAVDEWARGQALTLGVWHDDAGVELLGDASD